MKLIALLPVAPPPTDFSGRWKMLHHLAVDFFAPLLVSPHLDATSSTLTVDVVSDDALETALLVHVEVLDWRSFGPCLVRSRPVQLQGAGVVRAWQGPLRGLLDRCGCGQSCLLRFRLTDADNATALAPDNFLLPRSPKDSPMANAVLQVRVVCKLRARVRGAERG